MNKKKIAAYICIFAAVVMLVLAAACPFYRTDGTTDYNDKYDVIEGKDGFLFRARSASTDELGDFSGKNKYGQTELSQTVNSLSAISGKLRGAGCRTLFVMVPSKLSVYRDRLPQNVRALYSEERKFTVLTAALKEAGEEVLDLTAEFEAYKDKEQLYHTASDDINDVGGFRLFSAVARATGLGAVSGEDYELVITSDEAFPLCREYRNETGKTVPNRTLTLTEKNTLYKDAGYVYENTYATELISGKSGRTVYAADSGGASACRRFFSASADLAVFHTGIVPDDAVTERCKPDTAVFVICETELGGLPQSASPVVVEKDVSAAPLIDQTVYSDAGRAVIFGTVEKKSTITVKGGAETVVLRSEDGRFAAEVPILSEPETSVLTLVSKTDGKAESPVVTVDVRYDEYIGYKNVVIGKEGHLHYQETVPDFTGDTALSADSLAGYVGYLHAWADRIHKVSPHTKIILLIAPNHLTIYPETAPDSLAARKSDVTRLSQFTEAFKNDDRIIFPDLTSALSKAVKTSPYRLYNKTDTHWNELGAYYAYACVMELISRDYPSAAPDPLSDFDVFTKFVPGGDMANFLGADLNAVREEGVYVRSKKPLKSGINKDYAMNFENAWFSDPHEFTVDDPSLPTMIMYRDSFSTNLMSFFAEKFSRSVFHAMWDYPEELDLYAEMQPDYIILERVERSLGGL